MKTLASRSIKLLLALAIWGSLLLAIQAQTPSPSPTPAPSPVPIPAPTPATAPAPAPALALGQNKDTARIDQLLKDGAYNAQRKRDDIWVINRHGQNVADFLVIVSAQTGYVLVGVLVARKSEMRLNTELNFKLLRLADALDFVKVGLDSDEDLFVRTEIRTRFVDQQTLKELIDDVSVAADKTFGEIKPFLAPKP